MTDTAAEIVFDAVISARNELRRHIPGDPEAPEPNFFISEAAIAALTAAGLQIFTKQQAIDYVLDLPVEDFADTPLPKADALAEAAARVGGLEDTLRWYRDAQYDPSLSDDIHDDKGQRARKVLDKRKVTEEIEQDGLITVHPKIGERCHVG